MFDFRPSGNCNYYYNKYVLKQDIRIILKSNVSRFLNFTGWVNFIYDSFDYCNFVINEFNLICRVQGDGIFHNEIKSCFETRAIIIGFTFASGLGTYYFIVRREKNTWVWRKISNNCSTKYISIFCSLHLYFLGKKT